MKTIFQRLTLLAAMMLTAGFAFAQANNLVVFSQDGLKFSLIVNGLRQNEKPETNVKVTGLTAPNYKVRVIFEDANYAPIDQNIYMAWGGEDLHGKELICSIDKTKKGLKLRPNSVADITTTAASDQVVYQFNPSGNATQTSTYSTTTTTTTDGGSGGVTMTVGAGQTSPQGATTTTTVSDGTGGAATTSTTTTTTTTGTSDNVNVGMGMPGIGINININDGMGGTSTSSSTTTTTTTTSSSTTSGGTTTTTTAPPPATTTACSWPMSSADFDKAKKSVSGQSFEDGKLKVAKQVLNTNCMSVAQVKEIMALFSFEETKLDWAKFAYGKTTDPQNYYQLNDGFTYSTSVDDLNEYIENHK